MQQARESSDEDDEEEKKSGEQREYPGFLGAEVVRNIMQQVLTGLAEMHEAGVWHRDVKVDNIMFDAAGTVKFIDFNISKLIDEKAGGQEAGTARQRHTKNVVTRNYRPPEVFFGDVHYDGARVDTWSAGCVMAELLTNDGHFFPASSDIEQLCKIFDVLGTPNVETDWPECESLPTYLPFNPQEPKDLASVIRERREAQKPGAEAVPVEAIDLLGKLLALNPAKRLLPRQALSHAYF